MSTPIAQQQRTLVLYGRYPELGRTKTRLAASLGDDRTFCLYQALLADTAAKASTLPGCRLLAMMASSQPWRTLPEDPLKRDPFAGFTLLPQQGEGFGERLSHAMKSGLEGGTSTVLIGTDSPEIERDDLSEAFSLLNDHDLVLGPAVDGGYYLIGMKRFYPDLFRNIAWSTPVVREQTITTAHGLGLKVALVATRHDLDLLADLEALTARRRQSVSESPCPATDAWLKQEGQW
jgi:uncharacterized protein